MKVVTLIGGLGIFLFGMRYFSHTLESIATDKMRRHIDTWMKKPIVAMTIGVLAASLVQSSSVSICIIIGLLESGLIALSGAIAFVLGANIGTTLTAWMVALTVKVDLQVVAYPVIFAGVILSFLLKQKTIPNILIAIGFIFTGLMIMKGTFGDTDLSGMITRYGYNPLLGILIGITVTIVLQSSSATVALLQMVALGGLIDLDIALPIILGENIGTTITADIATLSCKHRRARRLAWTHTIINVFSLTYMMPLILFGLYQRLLMWVAPGASVPMQIALAHTGINLIGTAVWLPNISLLRRLTSRRKK